MICILSSLVNCCTPIGVWQRDSFCLALIPSVLPPKRWLHIQLYLDLLPNKVNRQYPEAWDILVAFFLLSCQFSRTQTLKPMVILQYLHNTMYCNIFLSASLLIHLPYWRFQYYHPEPVSAKQFYHFIHNWLGGNRTLPFSSTIFFWALYLGWFFCCCFETSVLKRLSYLAFQHRQKFFSFVNKETTSVSPAINLSFLEDFCPNITEIHDCAFKKPNLNTFFFLQTFLLILI